MLSHINKALLPMKVHYFLFNAGTGPVQPFLSTYARQLGFSATVVGLIYTILPICGMVAKPSLGAIADRFKCQKIIFLAGQLLTAAAFLSLNFSPEIPTERKVHFRCEGEAVFDTSPMLTDNSSINECVVTQFEGTSKTVACELDCLMTEQYWDVVVNNWNVSEYVAQHPNNLKITAYVNTSKIVNIGSIVYFPFAKVMMQDGTVTKPLCPTVRDIPISTTCNALCDDYSVNDVIGQNTVSSDVYGMHQFWIFLILMIFGWVGQAVAVSVGDAICFELLGDQPTRFGVQRMFGSLGWGIFSVIAGVMVDSLSDGSSKKNFASAFYLSFGFLLLDFALSTRIKYTQRKHSPSVLRDVGLLLTDIRILVFLIWCVCLGMCTGLMWNFLLFLVEDLAKQQGCDSQNWIKTLEGIIQAVQTLAGEMPFFFLSGKILKRIGHVHAMSLIPLVMGVRLILYSVIPNPWYFLPVELLNGLTFGLLYASMTSYASIVAPPGTEATSQGLVGAVFEGVGVSLGSFVAGVLYDEYGGPWTFRLFGIGALVVCLMHAAAQHALRRHTKEGKVYEARYTTPMDALSSLYDDQELSLVNSRLQL